MKQFKFMVAAFIIGISTLLMTGCATTSNYNSNCSSCSPCRTACNTCPRVYTYERSPYCDYYVCGGVTREFCHPTRYERCTVPGCN